jgi:cytochrome c peroxidase
VYVNFGKSIEAYERQVISGGSAFDRFRDEIIAGNSDSDELTPSQKHGLRMFVGKAGCISCHRGPNFSDWQFHNIGISQAEVPHVPERDTGREGGIESLENDEFNCVSRWSDEPDKGACAVAAIATRDADAGAFKTPTLRNVALTKPYFHTGAVDSLEAVVEFYDQGGEQAGYGTKDPNIRRLGLSEDEKRSLVDFLKSLTGQDVDPRLTTAPE